MKGECSRSGHIFSMHCQRIGRSLSHPRTLPPRLCSSSHTPRYITRTSYTPPPSFRFHSKSTNPRGMAASKHVLVPVANGTEEIEAVSIIDTLRRAGANVTVASVGDQLQVRCSRGVNLVADRLLKDVLQQQFDLIALPGGKEGADNLRDCAELKRLLLHQKNEGKPYAAICASPGVVFQTHGLFEGISRMTSHPSVADMLPKGATEDRVVVDKNCVTSRGPGTAMEFALKLVEVLYGKQKADEVAKPMLVNGWV